MNNLKEVKKDFKSLKTAAEKSCHFGKFKIDKNKEAKLKAFLFNLFFISASVKMHLFHEMRIKISEIWARPDNQEFQH